MENRTKQLREFGSSSAEFISYGEYTSSYEWTSDIQGEGVDIIVADTSFDIMHYEIRDNVQLVDWQYLLDNPTCTWQEWRANDITYDELNNLIKGYFQEILDEKGVDGWTKESFQNFNFRNAYKEKLIRDKLSLKYGYYLCLFGDEHGTMTASNIIGKTVGTSRKSPLFLLSGIYHLGSRPAEVEADHDNVINPMKLPRAFTECKKRSGITRPTLHSMSISWDGTTGPNNELNWYFDDNDAPDTRPVIDRPISQSFNTTGPLGGSLSVTIPTEVQEFLEMMVIDPVYGYQTWPYQGPLDSSESTLGRIKRENYVLNYIEKTWNLDVQRLHRNDELNGTVSNRFPRYKVQSIPIYAEDQIDGDNYRAYYANGGHSVRSAGNDSYARHSIEYMKNQLASHERSKPGGSITTRQWDTGSIINMFPRHATSSFKTSNSDIYAVLCTAPLSYINSTEHTTDPNAYALVQELGHASGSSTSIQDIEIKFPFAWRVRPIFSNISPSTPWGDSGKSWETYITSSFKYQALFGPENNIAITNNFIITTGSANMYTADLNIIKNDPAFIDNGVQLITGSNSEKTMPRLSGMAIDPDSLDVQESSQIRSTIALQEHGEPESLQNYNFNDTYNVLLGDEWQSFKHVPGQTSQHIALREFIIEYIRNLPNSLGQSVIFNDHTYPIADHFIGFLLEPYDENDNIILNKPLASVQKLKNSSFFAFTASQDYSFKMFSDINAVQFHSNYPISGSVGIEIPDTLELTGIPGFPYVEYSVLYFSGSFSLGTFNPELTNASKAENVHYVFNEDTDNRYSDLSNVTNALEKNREPVTEWDLYQISQSLDLKHVLTLLEESPTIGRGLRSVNKVYSPIKLSGWPTQMDADPRGIVAASATVHVQQDLHKPYYVSRSYHYPPTPLTASLGKTDKFFFIPSSSNELKNDYNFQPSDILADHANRGTRITIASPGDEVDVAQPMLLKNGVIVKHPLARHQTMLDYFNTSSIYFKHSYVFASCSYENMKTSAGEQITSLSFLTGSLFQGTSNVPCREGIVTNNRTSYAYGYIFYRYVDSLGRHNGYGKATGTSFACPTTAGVCALWLDLYPNLSQIELQQVLQQTAYHNVLKDQNIYSPHHNETINDFDNWLYGVHMPAFFRNNDNNPEIFVSSSYTTNLPIRELLDNAPNQGSTEQRLRKYLHSYTDYYYGHALRGTPNRLLHWPYSRTNRADVQGTFNGIQLSGSISFNKSGSVSTSTDTYTGTTSTSTTSTSTGTSGGSSGGGGY